MNAPRRTPETAVPRSSGNDEMEGTITVVDLNQESATGQPVRSKPTVVEPDDGPSAPVLPGSPIRENASRKPRPKRRR